MKLKSGFVLREVAGSCVVVPTGAELNFNGMISLNETGKLIWTCLENDTSIDEIIAALLAEYNDIDEATARMAVEDFIEKLRKYEFIAE